MSPRGLSARLSIKVVSVNFTLPVLNGPAAAADAPYMVEVAFKGMRKGFYVAAELPLRAGDWVVVETDRGRDIGRVRSLGGVARRKCGAAGGDADSSDVPRVLRPAANGEVEQLFTLRADEDRVRRAVRELVEQHHLKMKVTDAEWQWDRNKLTIYFTADRRVDFRELVRQMARTFRARIELKQIGVRDEAAHLGGVGRCGRELCCATWLREIKPISLQLAKDQNLSLNPQQISGTCGRLMCCLTYEHDAYVQARKRFPREGRVVHTAVGPERVIGIDIWRNVVTMQDENRQRRVVDLQQLRDEMAAQPPTPRDSAAASAAPQLPSPAEARPPRRPRRQPQPKPE